jgi:hypothetical protein
MRDLSPPRQPTRDASILQKHRPLWEVTSCFCTMQRLSLTLLHVVVPQASRDATRIPTRAVVFDEPPSADCHSGSEPTTGIRGQS